MGIGSEPATWSFTGETPGSYFCCGVVSRPRHLFDRRSTPLLHGRSGYGFHGRDARATSLHLMGFVLYPERRLAVSPPDHATDSGADFGPTSRGPCPVPFPGLTGARQEKPDTFNELRPPGTQRSNSRSKIGSVRDPPSGRARRSPPSSRPGRHALGPGKPPMLSR